MATKLTDAWVKNTSKPGITWDVLSTGLGLKVTSSGRKIWLMQLVWPGQASQSRRTLGRYPALTLDAARAQAGDWYAKAKAGVDPSQLQDEQRRKAEQEANNTFERVAEAFIATKRGRRAEKDAKAIRRHLVKAFKGKAVTSIAPRDVREMLAKLAKRAPYSANEIWGHASQLFRYAVHEELITASPMASLDKRLTLSVKLQARKRVLSDAELKALWGVADGLGYPEGDFYKVLILTGCRLSEAAVARWSEFDLAGGLWTIPAERVGNKSDQVRLVPLSPAVVAILEGCEGNGDYVFTNDGDTPINGFSKLKATVDAGMGDDVPPWVNHDLRRTVRTGLSALGVSDVVAELAIGHGRKGIQRVYDQYAYLSELRAALESWSARVASLISSA